MDNRRVKQIIISFVLLFIIVLIGYGVYAMFFRVVPTSLAVSAFGGAGEHF